jgi:putative FmdB family regulatory protein
MPTYTWKCSKCGYVEERLQASYDAPKQIKCKECSGKATKEIHPNPWKFGRLGM